MALSLVQGRRLVAAVSLLLIGSTCLTTAQQGLPQVKAGPSALDALDMSLSPECRVPGSLLYTLAPLKAVRAALDEKRPVKVLALGSAGGASGSAAYPVRLAGDLERLLGAGVDVEVEQRGLPGEITAEAVERITRLVAELGPDLVVWQAGTNDALAKADLDAFGRAFDEVLDWLSGYEIDVLLVEPPYTAASAEDEHYKGLISRVQEAARQRGLPVVLRFEALRFLARQSTTKGGGKAPLSAFSLNDLGARCIAEHVTRTVGLSLLLGAPSSPGPPETAPAAPP